MSYRTELLFWAFAFSVACFAVLAFADYASHWGVPIAGYFQSPGEANYGLGSGFGEAAFGSLAVCCVLFTVLQHDCGLKVALTRGMAFTSAVVLMFEVGLLWFLPSTMTQQPIYALRSWAAVLNNWTLLFGSLLVLSSMLALTLRRRALS